MSKGITATEPTITLLPDACLLIHLSSTDDSS
jgi:hypothetical protein